MPCVVRRIGGPLWISHAYPGIIGGMSGSPIVTSDGSAIGICVTGTGILVAGSIVATEGGPNPRLTYHLPGWFLRELKAV